MHIEASPLNLLGTSTSNHRPSGIFSIPALGDRGENLDTLLLRLHSLWTNSGTLFTPEQVSALKAASMDLDQHCTEWEDSRLEEFKSVTIGDISHQQEDSEIPVGYWPGKVDTYFDLYVAGVWNIFRSARLLLIALIMKHSDMVRNSENYIKYTRKANTIVKEMIASIPFHLADNLQVFRSQLSEDTRVIEPGKYLGGLLLIHPLYVASEMSFVPETMREYLRRCLEWIGLNMGFGQATLLASVCNHVLNYTWRLIANILSFRHLELTPIF